MKRLRARLAQHATRLGLLAVAAAQHTGSPPDLSGTIDVETSFGTLALEEGDPGVTAGLLALGEWEPGETALFGERLKPGMTFVDVGAHAGYFSVQAGRLVGPRGLVVAFEPAPRNFELLLANVWRNGLTNVVCFPWAVGARNGFVDLHLCADNSGDHRAYSVDGERERVTVRCVALDSIEALRPPVDVIKIDVQGLEHEVLQGARALLAGSPGALVTVEFWPQGIHTSGGDPREVLASYRSLGYDLLVQDPEERGEERLADDEIVSRCGAERHVNLVLVRAA